MEVKTIGIASDHAGYALKQFVKKYLDDNGYQRKDYGTFSEASCDYSDFGHALAEGIERGEVFERITCAGPHDALQRQMTDRVMARHDGEAPADPERSLLMAFVTEATLAIYRQWVADGKSLPADQVANIAAKYVCHGAL